MINDPKRPVCPVLGTAGLTQAFFGDGRAGLWETAFQNQSAIVLYGGAQKCGRVGTLGHERMYKARAKT